MQTYRYWHKESAEIRIDGTTRAIVCWGRSNASAEEARNNALARAGKVQKKLRGEDVVKEDYSADIREQLVREIDAHNVITRNRYGALVLNTDSTTIIDIDQHRKTFLEKLGFAKRDNKAAILDELGNLASRPEYRDIGLRTYETAKGVRVIVSGAYYDPNGQDGRVLLERCNADPVFSLLCRKQNCYRARLTPKPYRIKHKGMRYRWPMEPQAIETAKAWIREYEVKSENYAICRYLETFGRQAPAAGIIALHDEATRAASRLPLA